jgi:hypothetical protein
MDLQTKLKLINNYLENECANIQWREMMTEYRQYLMSFKAEAKPSPDDPVTRRQILEEAINAVCTDRNHQYGGPEQSFTAIAEMWTAYLHCKGHDITIDSHDAAMMLTLFKAARVTTSDSPKADTYVDLAGYAACAGELACGGDNNG